MLALKAFLIRVSNSTVDCHAYLNQLAALSRRDIAFSVSAQKQKVSRTMRPIIINLVMYYAVKDYYTNGILS